MLLALGALIAAPSIAPSIPWVLGFAPKDRLPLAADLDGDGFGDLVSVSPRGECFIDVAINGNGQKTLVPKRALSRWDRDCQAVVALEFDDKPGADVLGLFEGARIRVAGGWNGRELSGSSEPITLPTKLEKPRMAALKHHVLVWSEASGQGYRVHPKTRTLEPVALPRSVTWVSSDEQTHWRADGTLTVRGKRIGKHGSGAPVLANGVLFAHEVPVGEGYATFPKGDPHSVWSAVDMDRDGDEDLLEFRNASGHMGCEVRLHRWIRDGETDSDADGLSNDSERALGTDPLDPDTDNDALLDGWEVGTYRDLDLKALGCSPRKQDVLCLISRFEQVDEAFCKQQLSEVQRYYREIASANPDGTNGWNLHLIYLDPIKEADQKKPWWELRDRLRPAKWKGLVHWMQITPWGGGQADSLGDGGGCGGGGWALYATFIHEFGHQLGLPHEGFYEAAWCPTYPSLMNYAYSYTLEDDIKNVRYSDGRLAQFKMRETALSEIIPLPYEKIKFLEKAPYRYRLKPEGDRTLIDWNWNGVFGEQRVRADVNYSYSTTAGRRDEAGKLHSAPTLFTHQGRAYVLYAQHAFPADPKTDPTVSKDKPGALWMRRLIQPYKWEEPVLLETGGVTGDPVAISYAGRVLLAYPSADGVVTRWIEPGAKEMRVSAPTIAHRGLGAPSLAIFGGRLLLAVWSPETKRTTYRWWIGSGFGEPRAFNFLSTVPIGMAEDPVRKRLIVGLAWDQDASRPSRWQVRRYSRFGDALLERDRDWIEGVNGGARGQSRVVVLYDPSTEWGPEGRVYFFGLGMLSPQAPWSCAYVAHTIGDKSVNGGWRVKRYYDEWTQSRSAPAAAWFGGDIVYAYRWVDGGQTDRDNLLHVAYRGTGIEDVEMGDFDDIGFIRQYGFRYSILTMLER